MSEISIIHGDSSFLLLESIEGDDGEDWPPSPPIQEFVEQTLGADKLLLGIGRAGQGHWSVSVCSAESGLDFDIACRADDPTGWLGSTYQSDQQEPGSPIDCPAGQLQIMPFTDTPSMTQLLWRGKQISMIPAGSESGDSPSTKRWRYRICLV